MSKLAILNVMDWARFVDATNAKLKKNFKAFEIDIKDIKDMVSRKQQSYIYGCVYPRLRQALLNAGYEIQNITDDQFDYFMRSMFYFDIVKTSKGEAKIPRRLCFEKGYKEDVSQYIDDLLRFAAKLGCYIPSQF